jgi:hypothetical protein
LQNEIETAEDEETEQSEAQGGNSSEQKERVLAPAAKGEGEMEY